MFKEKFQFLIKILHKSVLYDNDFTLFISNLHEWSLKLLIERLSISKQLF